MEEYISKEEIINECRRYGDHEHNVQFKPGVSEHRKHSSEVAMFMCEHFKKFTEKLPSADVRPNIHGHWIKINSGDEDFPESIVCDRCNHENSHLDFNEHNEPIGKVFVTSNFCPNCGADMREPIGEKGTE